MQNHKNILSLTKITRQDCNIFFCAYKNLGSDPKGNLIPAIIGGAAMIGAVINVGFYVGKNVGRVRTKDFNLGNGYILFIRSCFEITCKIRIDTLSKLPLHTQKKRFPLRISSVNVTKSAVKCGFGHIY